jgi:hypothetical protein
MYSRVLFVLLLVSAAMAATMQHIPSKDKKPWLQRHNDWPICDTWYGRFNEYNSGKFRGAVYDGASIWLVPYQNGENVMKITKSTGEITCIPWLDWWGKKFTAPSNGFNAGAYDNANGIWFNNVNMANGVYRLLKTNETFEQIKFEGAGVSLKCNWTAAYRSYGTPHFDTWVYENSIPLVSGGFSDIVYDGTSAMWLVPYNAEHVVKIAVSAPTTQAGWSLTQSGLTCYSDWPVAKGLGTLYESVGTFQSGSYILEHTWSSPPTIIDGAFAAGVAVGTDLWMIPFNADRVIKVSTAGVMTGYATWPTGFKKYDAAFSDGVYDGSTYIWMIPYKAKNIVRINKDTGVMDVVAWPSDYSKGMVKGFGAGVYDGTYVWLVPLNPSCVIRVHKTSHEMTCLDDWPKNFEVGWGKKGHQRTPGQSNYAYDAGFQNQDWDWAFSGGVYDGSNIWMSPYNADCVIKINMVDDKVDDAASTIFANLWIALAALLVLLA